MSEPMTPERLCGLCQLPLSDGEVGIRYFGMYTAHSESRCRELLRMEIDRLRASQATAHERYERLLDGNDRLQRENREFRARVKELGEALTIIAGPTILTRDGCRPIARTALDWHASPNQDDVAEEKQK